MSEYNYGTTIGLLPYISNLGENLIGCEIGVWEGHNLGFMLHHLPNINMIYAIDPWHGYLDWIGHISQDILSEKKQIAFTRIANFPNRVQVMEMNSAEALPSIPQLDFVFIDGDHSHEGVLNDLRMYHDKVRSGGIVAGHDWNLDTVQSAVNQFRAENNIHVELMGCESYIWFWYKP